MIIYDYIYIYIMQYYEVCLYNVLDFIRLHRCQAGLFFQVGCASELGRKATELLSAVRRGARWGGAGWGWLGLGAGCWDVGWKGGWRVVGWGWLVLDVGFEVLKCWIFWQRLGTLQCGGM